MYDKLGKEIKVGSWIDLHLSGMFNGYVTEVHDRIVIPGQAERPASITVNIPLPLYSRDGMSLPVYLRDDIKPVQTEEPPKPPIEENGKIQ